MTTELRHDIGAAGRAQTELDAEMRMLTKRGGCPCRAKGSRTKRRQDKGRLLRQKASGSE